MAQHSQTTGVEQMARNNLEVLKSIASTAQINAAAAWKARCDGWQAGLTIKELNTLQTDYDAAAKIEAVAVENYMNALAGN